ncbi:hypothetical protein A9K71_25810 [Mesorhizobium sp. WSM3873]|nr:hypothetical protein A9K71_25810 [Mesorhizobium sp. WSM3873]
MGVVTVYNIDFPLLAAIASALACVLSLIALFYLGMRINHLKGFALEPSQFEQGFEKLQAASREDSRNGREELQQILARFLQLVESRLATLGTSKMTSSGRCERKQATAGQRWRPA